MVEQPNESTEFGTLATCVSDSGTGVCRFDSGEAYAKKPDEICIKRREEKRPRLDDCLEEIELMNRRLSTVSMDRVPRKMRFDDSYNAASSVVQDLLFTVLSNVDNSSVPQLEMPNEVDHV